MHSQTLYHKNENSIGYKNALQIAFILKSPSFLKRIDLKKYDGFLAAFRYCICIGGFMESVIHQ